MHTMELCATIILMYTTKMDESQKQPNKDTQCKIPPDHFQQAKLINSNRKPDQWLPGARMTGIYGKGTRTWRVIRSILSQLHVDQNLLNCTL